MEHIEEEIPDRGRHLIICNKCISETYPDCIAKCGVEKQWRNQKVNIVKS
jgi:predicted nucleic acid-binding Zn ribbon protein